MWENLQNLMDERGISIADLVRGTGISYSTFTDWKAGRYTPKSDKRQKIANYLGVSLQYLDTGKPEDEALYLIRMLIDRKAVRDLVEVAVYCDDETLLIINQLLQKLKSTS